MKKITLLFLSALTAQLSYGQQTEFSLHLTSGAAAFRGDAAQSNSFILLPTTAGMAPYTNNAYGSRPGLSYGAAAQGQRVTAGHMLWGLQAGYEQLRSRVSIDNVLQRNGVLVRTDGHTMLTNSFINVHPFFGHRFLLGSVDLDLTVGPEVGLLLRSHEQGEAVTAEDVRYRTDLNRSHPTADVRGRLNLTAYYKRAGISAGYSSGLTNYYAGNTGPASTLYLQAFRAGLTYRIYGL